MSDFNPDNPSDFDADDRGSLAWNEFDWERYLKEQDDVTLRYLGFYELLRADPERIDKVAQCMGWNLSANIFGDDDDDSDGDEDDAFDPMAPYTVCRNAIYVATKALYLDLTRKWERIAECAAKVPQPLAVAFLSTLHAGENQAVLAIHALDFGDYAMAVSLFKRALHHLNRSFALLDENTVAGSKALSEYRATARMELFDLREMWLRMTRECRAELERQPLGNFDDDGADDDDADDDLGEPPF